jgi:hypothetical protein
VRGVSGVEDIGSPLGSSRQIAAGLPLLCRSDLARFNLPQKDSFQTCSGRFFGVFRR